MNLDRYSELMDNQESELTPEEINLGWHFCNEFDGLLVGPEMGELSVCKCLPEDHPVYKTYPERIGRDWINDSSLEKWFPITASELDQLRAENARLRQDLMDPPADIQEAVIKKLNLVSGEALLKAKDERDAFHRCLIAREQSLKNEGERWVKAMTERDEARADNERLKSEVEALDKDLRREVDDHDKSETNLQAHKTALEKAREVIRDCQMHIEADNIDWSRFQEGPDHDPNYKPQFPEIVERCAKSLASINELLQKGSK